MWCSSPGVCAADGWESVTKPLLKRLGVIPSLFETKIRDRLKREMLQKWKQLMVEQGADGAWDVTQLPDWNTMRRQLLRAGKLTPKDAPPESAAGDVQFLFVAATLPTTPGAQETHSTQAKLKRWFPRARWLVTPLMHHSHKPNLELHWVRIDSEVTPPPGVQLRFEIDPLTDYVGFARLKAQRSQPLASPNALPAAGLDVAVADMGKGGAAAAAAAQSEATRDTQRQFTHNTRLIELLRMPQNAKKRTLVFVNSRDR